MKKIKTVKIHNTALLFILIAPFTIAFYASYIFNPVHRGDLWLYLLQILADGIAIINLGTLWLTILLDLIQPEYHKRDMKYDPSWAITTPLSVDILIPVANESLTIIKATLESAKAINYPHQTYVLDDGGSLKVKQIAKNLKIKYLARPRHQKSYAKSGNLNYGLKHCDGEFFAIFDADHIPEKEFLSELLPFFENEKVALVQTPQHYTNTQKFIAKGTALAQDVFYKYIQPAKNSYNASFCVGTNMLYRRSAVETIGGIALIDHSEDIWTTILLHEKKWESVYYNKVLAHGRAPETIPDFFQQQNRWAMGGFSLFFKRNPLFLSQLTTDQKLQYTFSNIHYFSAFSILIYLFLPINYMLTGNYSMNVMDSSGWLVHFIPYFITVYFLPLFLLGQFSLATVSTAIASFAPYLKAFFSVVLKNKYTWIATGAERKKSYLIMNYIWPHIFIIVLSLLSIIVGWYNASDIILTITITFWILVNTYLLYIFVRNGVFAYA
ncbi:MAG TPA: glycosyltransferase [Methylomirabilota bacterium]|nr:glycosyltransferase [Methylomirabilota bacterium]